MLMATSASALDDHTRAGARPSSSGTLQPLNPMNPYRFTTIAHADHEVMSPLADESTARLLAALEVPRAASVIDIGCGNGAMLTRLLRGTGASGVGIDRNPAMIDRARQRSAGLIVEWVTGDAMAHPLLSRRYDSALCVGATGALGGLIPALRALRVLVGVKGTVLVGEGYWRTEPESAYLEMLGASRDEMTDLAELHRRVEGAGFAIVTAHTSTAAEWNEYEGRYAAAIERFVESHPDDPDAPAFKERIARWIEAYRRWGRATLGFESMVLRADGRTLG